MKRDLKSIPEDMKTLGLSALAHANRIDAKNDKWEELSVLQIAHAAEILVKARIAKEHPLLIFEKYPKPDSRELSLEKLFQEGHTIEWSSLLDLLWATTSLKLSEGQKRAFKDFGKLRNGIQHFGVLPKTSEGNSFSYLESLKFTYGFIDPFINKCWRIYAIDYSDDYDIDEDDETNKKYWDFIKNYIVANEIYFRVSPTVAHKHQFWWDEIKDELSSQYKNKIQKQIDKQTSQPK